MDKDTFIQLMEEGINKKFNLENFPDELQKQFKEYIEFKYLLTTESDRGAVLFASSYIDFLLEKILRIKLIGNKKHLDTIFGFNGALGTFSSKISMCYSLGLFPKEFFEEINTIRKIRNIFGHSPEKIDFESEKISNIIQNLNFLPDNFDKPNRTKFNRSLSFLIGALEGISKTEKIFEENNKDKFDDIFESLRKLGLK